MRRETGDEPARTSQGGPTLAYQLWQPWADRGGVYMRPVDQETVWIGNRNNGSHLDENESACREPIHARTPGATGPSDVL